MAKISLPVSGGKFAPYTTGEPIAFPSKADTLNFNRIAFAAAHVVADPLADIDPWLDTASIGTRPSPSATTCGISASASPRRWTPRSAAAGSIGRRQRS